MAAPKSDARTPVPLPLLDGAALVGVLVLLFCVAARQISAVDFWWQLATGAWVLENGFPRTDAFSFSVPDNPWIELRWLYCVVLHLVVDTIGPGAAVLGKIVITGLTLGLGLRCVPERRMLPAGLALACLALVAMSNRLYVRPELASGLFILVFLYVIHRERVRGGRLTLVLPALQVLWVNTHTLFVLGPAIVGAWMVAEVIERFTGYGGASGAVHESEGDGAEAADGVKRSLIVLGLSGIACVVNPWLFQGALMPVTLFTQLQGTAYSTEIGELLGPFVGPSTGPAIPCYVVLIVLAIGTAILNLARLDLLFTIVNAAFLYLSTTAVRNVPLFVTVAVPFVLLNLRDTRWLWQDGLARLRGVAGQVTCVAVVAVSLFLSFLLVTNRFSQAENSRFGLAVNPYVRPEAAVDFLEEKGILGERVFNYLNEGAYLLYRGYPVYFDPRLEVYGEEHLLEYRRAGSGAQAFQEIENRYDFPIVMLGSQPDKLAVAKWLVDSGRWRMVFIDHRVFILLKTGFHDEVGALDLETDLAVWTERWRRTLPDLGDSGGMGSRPPVAPYLKLGVALSRLGVPTAAQPFLEDALVLDPDAAVAHQVLGEIAYRLQDFEAAVRHYAQALARIDDPKRRAPVQKAYLLARGLMNHKQGKVGAAIKDLEQAYQMSGDAAIGRILERMRREAGQPPR